MLFTDNLNFEFVLFQIFSFVHLICISASRSATWDKQTWLNMENNIHYHQNTVANLYFNTNFIILYAHHELTFQFLIYTIYPIDELNDKLN